jgi:ABC-type transport system substrate-binding protein
VQLADRDAVPATSLVPLGIAGHGDEDFSPRFDPQAARAELEAAGYPGGAGFPEVTLVTSGSDLDDAIAHELRRNLGIRIAIETMPFDEFTDRLDRDPPQLWGLNWIADFPHAQDFLGLLLETGSASNLGRWSDPRFDAALEAAAASFDPTEQARRYEEAQSIVRDEVPLIPVRYGVSWALSRDGLAGAGQSGLGYLRFAGLAWSGVGDAGRDVPA